jgi:hypothetical protein
MLPDNELRTALSKIAMEASNLLNHEGIREILDYCWEDHDTLSGEYVGLAMWQTHPPTGPSFFWNDQTGDQGIEGIPDTQSEKLYKSGEDFIGTMQFARQSLGLSLCYSVVAETGNLFNDDSEFWAQYATTLQWMNIALDRLLELFKGLKLPNANKRHDQGTKRRERGSTSQFPTFEKSLLMSSSENKPTMIALEEAFSKLEALRSDRNAIVHQVAARSTQRKIDLLKHQKYFVNAPGTSDASVGGLSPLLTGEALTSETIQSAVKKMKEWYSQLVTSSSLIFELEHFSRQKLS